MIRVGLGYDAHRLKKGRPLILGGVRIRHPKGLEGHSDADVLVHSIVDALLGAAGLPDIGTYFSNKDPRWRNVSSLVFLKEVRRILKSRKAKTLNVDCTLLAEEPKISPYIREMKSRVSQALGIPESSVGIKASTTERMGFVGKKEGMCAYAVALIKI